MVYTVLSHYTEVPETILDVGCGNGHTIEYLNKLWPDTLYYGVDLSDVAIDLAREKVPGANFISGSYEDADIPYCDVVILMGVAEHFENLLDSLSDMKNYGDLIYIESPNCLGYSNDNEEGFRTTTKLDGATIFQREWHLSRSTWEGTIKHAGLDIIQTWTGPTPETEFIWLLKGI